MQRVLWAAIGSLPLTAAGPSGPDQPIRTPLRALVGEARLLAAARDNGCLDEPAPAQTSWPDGAAGVAINPRQHEVYASDSVSNALFMFHRPELFNAPGTSTAQDRNR